MEEVMLKDLPESELPRERFLRRGPSNLSDEEILSILLRCGYKNVNVKVLSSKILKVINGLENLKNMSVYELSSIKGVGLTKAITLLASVELGKRVCLKSETEKEKLNNSKKIYERFKSLFWNQKQELFYVLYLDTNKRLISSELLFKGTLDSSTVHPREIFKCAVKYSAASIILMHNHPSGSLEPSVNDIDFTDTIKTLGKMMGIKIIDHIIFTNESYFSFFENGLMK